MISAAILKQLITQRIKDAECLFKGKRYQASIYLMGYAIEFALKRRICLTLGFNQGFPENSFELKVCLSGIATGGFQVALPGNIRDIKHHDLTLLLQYSGLEPRIRLSYSTDWFKVAGWNPENRYMRQRIFRKRAEEFIKIAKRIIVRELL